MYQSVSSAYEHSMNTTCSKICVCELYHLIICMNQHQSATKPAAGTQRQQVFVLDSTTDGHVKRRTNTPLHHPWETTVRTASCIFSNGSREFSTSSTVRRHSVMVGWLVSNWTGKDFNRLDRGYSRKEAGICLEGLGNAQKCPQVIQFRRVRNSSSERRRTLTKIKLEAH